MLCTLIRDGPHVALGANSLPDIIQLSNHLIPFFYRYRHEFRSDKLWTEIKYVLGSIAMPLTELFNGTVNLIPQHATNKDVIKVGLLRHKDGCVLP